ncbi:glycosyltransferase [Oceanobacillus sp. J11TS1]|uniref:MGDG synthase family glycosyltransferase n=1 Tax=Oceanobacillus sp. J11TS1 TaxID=2807191 RepID=UPI001B25207B|nr:glycosyltransferase [Oceanobacillus sp. J11TS1]GIO24840.1 putative glycosyltransferase YkoN [Oceanobacillus sp. J11TS1]
MFRVLFMPFLRIPSGHHHAADSIKDQLEYSDEISEEIDYDKLEILSHCFGKLESFISSLYLQSIHKVPAIYSQIYRFSVVKGSKSKIYQFYDRLFLKKMLQALEARDPHLVICTHSLPSYLLSKLKENNQWSGKVVNVYTDYFVNDLWAINHIDYHFVPSEHVKQELKEKGVLEKNIRVTGIPIHPIFKQQTRGNRKAKEKLIVLVSGGNMGAGSIEKLLQSLNASGTISYYVLCGKNHVLYRKIQQLHNSEIKAIPYLRSKEDMNKLYDKADAIITKPGGVTVTECLWKKLPIFVYEALPGQEEFNLHYLKRQGLVFHLEDWKDSSKNMEEQILNRLQEEHQQWDVFHQGIENEDIAQIIKEVLC